MNLWRAHTHTCICTDIAIDQNHLNVQQQQLERLEASAVNKADHAHVS